MIHITLIDYKKLFENAEREIEELKFEKKAADDDMKALKTYHNQAVERSEKCLETLAAMREEHTMQDERLCNLLGGYGSLEDRINGAKEVMEKLRAENAYLKSEILTKDYRIADLMEENIPDRNEEAKELSDSYKRLYKEYYSLKEMYDKAQETIDRLCNN